VPEVMSLVQEILTSDDLMQMRRLGEMGAGAGDRRGMSPGARSAVHYSVVHPETVW